MPRGPRPRHATVRRRCRALTSGRLGRAGAGDRCACLRGTWRASGARVSRRRISCTATPGTWWRQRSWPRRHGLRRRYTQPTGSVEINAKRDGASAWAGVSTPDFVDVPIDSLLEELSTRLGWARRTVELPAGRYETIMPPSTVADMMIYLAWTMEGRGAQEGRTALSAPGGGTRVGEKLTDLPLTLYSDPAADGLACTPFVAATEFVGAGVGLRQRHGHRAGRLDPRRHDQRAGVPAGRGRGVRCAGAVPADNLVMTGARRAWRT